MIEDYIGDILDYANLNVASVTEAGGVYDEETMKVRWENVTIPAKSSVEMSFEVQLKDPVPATNSVSTSASYDCTIENTYGNQLSLDVDCPAVKGIETIPNTGPGESLAMITGITVVVGYFFARSRQLSKEIDIVRTDYAVTGGM